MNTDKLVGIAVLIFGLCGNVKAAGTVPLRNLIRLDESFQNRIVKLAYNLAMQGSNEIRFGAVLVGKNGNIHGVGRNQLSTPSQRQHFNPMDWISRSPIAAQLRTPRTPEGSLDYAIHAEQSAIADALSNKKGVSDSLIYVLGVRKDGLVGRRAFETWTCRRCAVWMESFGIRAAMLMTPKGWKPVSTEKLYPLAHGYDIQGKGYWAKQVQNQDVRGIPSYEWVSLDRVLK